MTSIPTCPRCGARLERGACPACLFDLALKRSAPDMAHDIAPADAPSGASNAEDSLHFVPPTLEEVARALPGFDQLAPLGRGGMGSVFRAHELALDRTVAIKVLPRELGARADFRERFLREARALARLNHPSVVNVHGAGEAGGLCYLVMEFVDGRNLRELLRERRVSASEALNIVRALCDALQYTHDEGVVHRDLKPENVLIDRAGRVKLADFGLAKLIGVERDVQLTRTDQVMGTPHYMAPEQLERPAEVDHRADLFALGVILYELLTGSLPRGAFELPSRRVDVDVRVDEIVLKALEREPARRYQHALEVKGDVDGLDRPARASEADHDVEAPERDARRTLASRIATPLLFALYWIALAWAWNQGEAALAMAGVLLAPVCAGAAWLALRADRVLADSIRSASPLTWVSRTAGALIALFLTLAAAALGHVSLWEQGVSNWRPTLRGSYALQEFWSNTPWSLVRLCGVEPARLTEPVLALTSSDTTERAIDLGSWAPLWVALATLGLLTLAVRSIVDPRPPALRRRAWTLSAELASNAVAAMVVLWIATPVAARRGESTLTQVQRTFTTSVALDDALERIELALSQAGLEVSVSQHGALRDARSAQSFAHVRLARAESASLRRAWKTSWAGPKRASPKLWMTIVRADDGDTTTVQLQAGLYPPRSDEFAAAQSLLRELEAELARE